MPTTDLMVALVISSVEFIPNWRQEFSRQAGGTPRVADIGPEAWTAKITAGPMTNAEILQAEAVINSMRGSLDTFYAWNPRAQYPQSDPDGTILGASAVHISALGGDSKSLGLSGLPAGYVITQGDFISWDNGTHRCLHQFVKSVTADAFGDTALVEVAPHILVGLLLSPSTPVTLVQPTAEMMIMPGSYSSPSSGALTGTMSFTAVQVP